MPLRLAPKTWPIWTQIVLAFIVVTTLVLLVSVAALRSNELAYLEQDIRSDQENIDSLLINATVDAIITQDIPVLHAVLDGVIANHPYIHQIDISDARNRVLYRASNGRDLPPVAYALTHHKDIAISGEKFGTATITWDLRSQYADIDRHLEEARRYTGAAMLFLALFLILPLYLLVAQPLRVIRRRIDTITDSQLEPVPPLASSREIRLISESLNTLATTLARQNEHERSYRERLEKEVAERTAELNRLYEEMKHHATHDRLTSLPNRALLAEHAQQAMARAKREKNLAAVLYIDMDGFKAINDSFGHQAGDDILLTLAQRLRDTVRAEDTVARLGGDEFSVLLPNLKSASDAATVAAKLLAQAGTPISIQGQDYNPKLSIGISLYPEDADNMEALLKMADTAMYYAKEHGGNAFHFYNALFQNQSSRQLALKNEIQRAISDNELVLYFQPIINLRSGQIASFEALVRWLHPNKGLIQPLDFIPLAESNGQIVQIDHWVIESLLGQIRNFTEIAGRPVKVSANLSSRSFRDSGLFSRIEASQSVSALLDIEITESTMLVTDARSQRSFDTLKNIGVRLTLDDFGTGYSSLSYLTSLPISGIKIDRSFITAIDTHERNGIMVGSILGLCHQLGLSVVAEGVETREELNWLRAHDCDAVQGYYFSRPVPYKEAAELLKKDFKTLF